MKKVRPVLLLAGVLSVLLLHAFEPPLHAASLADDTLQKEADFICDCSFTEDARNHQGILPSANAYGALNVDRIYQRGPDWVPTGESCMGVIGLMAAAAHLNQSGYDTARYERVLDRFFHQWVVARQEPFDTDPQSPDRGGCFQRVYYTVAGQRQREDPANAGVTGQMIAAMWKYYEFNVAIGNNSAANDWLQEGWPIASQAGEFLLRNYDSRSHLVRSNSASRNLWITDSAYAAMAFLCLDRWAAASSRSDASAHTAMVQAIGAGLKGLEDNSSRKGFFRYRDGADPSLRPSYGDQIDQLCFLPYEVDVLDPGDPFARQISEWWTYGSDGIQMTVQSGDPTDWRNFGTHLRHYFQANPENDNLYPGAGLQLAKMEWKYGHATGDPVMLDRARQRLEWARSPVGSNLWLGGSGLSEANVPNGVVDWRDSDDYTHKAEDWARFVDTSANFIEVTLMVEDGIDTKLVPN
jgi:hypothetical protein